MSNIKKDLVKGTYYFVISAGFYEDGKRKQIKRSGFKTKKEAQQKLLEIKNELVNQTFIESNSTLLGDYIKTWLKKKHSKVANPTYVRYERLCRLHIIPKLGKIKVQKVNQVVIQNFIDYLAEDLNFARKSCLLAKTILKDVFRLAMKEKIVKINPVYEIELPKSSKKKMLIWDIEHFQKFLSLRNEEKISKYYVAILTALLTGCRKGEILGLTWDNVDLNNNIIYITQILESDGSAIVQRTKNKKFRQILIPEILKDKLILYRKFQETDSPFNPDNLVFCTRRGKRVIPNTLNDVLYSMCKKYDLPRIKFHDLRHTHATLLLKENVNIKLIQERLGHSRITTTLDVYSHVLPSMQHIVTQKLDEMSIGD